MSLLLACGRNPIKGGGGSGDDYTPGPGLGNSADDPTGTSVGAADFGLISSTINPARQLQFALKLEF